MTSNNIFNQEDVLPHMFFTSEGHPSFYTTHVDSTKGELKKSRRRKKSKCGVDSRKRKLTVEQVNNLEYSFNIDHNLETQRKERIAAELGLDHQQVAIWFQNRRVRWRVKQLQEEYMKLKASHECVIADKSHLEAEVITLKAKLSDAEKELKRLAEQSNGGSSCSESSSFSMYMDPDFLGGFGMEGIGNLFHFYDNNSKSEMGWVNNVYNW